MPKRICQNREWCAPFFPENAARSEYWYTFANTISYKQLFPAFLAVREGCAPKYSATRSLQVYCFDRISWNTRRHFVSILNGFQFVVPHLKVSRFDSNSSSRLWFAVLFCKKRSVLLDKFRHIVDGKIHTLCCNLQDFHTILSL